MILPQTLGFPLLAAPEHNDTLADVLEQLAENGPPDAPFQGICYHAQCMCHTRGYVDGVYDFVASVSDGYIEFYDADGGARGDDGWEGKKGEFRRNWCREAAAALRAGEIHAVVLA